MISPSINYIKCKNLNTFALQLCSLMLIHREYQHKLVEQYTNQLRDTKWINSMSHWMALIDRRNILMRLMWNANIKILLGAKVDKKTTKTTTKLIDYHFLLPLWLCSRQSDANNRMKNVIQVLVRCFDSEAISPLNSNHRRCDAVHSHSTIYQN